MKFFIPCWIALSAMFPPDPSTSYVRKQTRTLSKRIATCNRIANIADEEQADPALLIALAFNATRFAKYEDPLNIGPLHPCKNCDLARIGTRALIAMIDNHDGDLCKSLAQFSGGPQGKCKEGHREFLYAARVIGMAENLRQILNAYSMSDGTRRPSSSNF